MDAVVHVSIMKKHRIPKSLELEGIKKDFQDSHYIFEGSNGCD
jgi:hypothetical protein